MRHQITALTFCVPMLIVSTACSVSHQSGTAAADVSEAYRHPTQLRYSYAGMTFQVEGDGRHIAAFTQDGRLQWRRDPFADARLPQYRGPEAWIVWIGPAQKWMIEAMNGRGSGKYVSISYNSTQSGVLDIKTGDFTFMGQD